MKLRSSYHQVQIRKDGPIHAVEFVEGRYSGLTACGMSLTGLEQIKRRIFPPDTAACGRCSKSQGPKR